MLRYPERSSRCVAWSLAGLLALGGAACDTPATVTPAPAQAGPATTVFVAFDTTATCQMSMARGQSWTPLDVNALVRAPLAVHDQQGTSWSTSHPATGSAWLEVGAAQPCLLTEWVPQNIPIDPSAPVYVWLGESGCERLDPILGSAADVHDGAYQLTAVLPARVQSASGASLVDAVRLRSEDGTKRLTIERSALERCVHAEPRPSSTAQARAVALPISGAFGPSPLVLAHGRLKSTRAPLRVSPSLQGAPRSVVRAFEGKWSEEARAVEWGSAEPLRMRVRTSVEAAAVGDGAAGRAEAPPNPEHQRQRARVEAERIAVAWAALEARYPSEGASTYLEAAQARLRRREAELQTMTEKGPMPTTWIPAPDVMSVEGMVEIDGFTVASRFSVQAWTEGDASAKQKQRALQQQAASRLRRLADVAQLVRTVASDETTSVYVDAGPGAGLLVTASLLVGGPVALVHGWLAADPGGVVELPVSLPPGRDCAVFAAESLGGADDAPVRLDLGIVNESAFTSLASDLRGVPRPAMKACGLPTEGDLVLRIESDVPVALGMLADGDDLGAGHLIASARTRLLPLTSNPSLDGALGLPEPVDLAESAAEAGRIVSTFTEENDR